MRFLGNMEHFLSRYKETVTAVFTVVMALVVPTMYWVGNQEQKNKEFSSRFFSIEKRQDTFETNYREDSISKQVMLREIHTDIRKMDRELGEMKALIERRYR